MGYARDGRSGMGWGWVRKGMNENIINEIGFTLKADMNKKKEKDQMNFQSIDIPSFPLS